MYSRNFKINFEVQQIQITHTTIISIVFFYI